ncbi:MAG: hypothetical protein IKN27_10180, partial [Selenomonadaceae bacterium]|nr:hypothetical protein [Selenomonadaceae bacterium]
MAKTIVNRDGKAIFRYNNKTHSVELATGESLDKLYETAQRENEKITNQSDTAIDFLQRFNDNEIYIGNVILRRLQNDNFMNQINDNMTIAQFREKVLRNENGAVSQATILYNKCANANKVDTKELESRRTRLKEALANATRARRTFNSIGMLEKVGTALRSKNKGRKDSRLAETLQRALDGRRAENAGGLGGELLVLQIPGEYRGMYETPIAKELIAEIRQDEMRSEKQGAFSLDATAQQPTDNAALVKQFGGRIVNDKPVFDNA